MKASTKVRVALGAGGFVVGAGVGGFFPPPAAGLMLFGTLAFGIALLVKRMGHPALKVALFSAALGAVGGGAVRQQTDESHRADARGKADIERKAKESEKR